jgi:hypothetical protein
LKTVNVVVRHFETDAGLEALDLCEGRLFQLGQNAAGRQLLRERQPRFPTGMLLHSDWLYERSYDETPPSRMGEDSSGFGDIPFQCEDLLLALRLQRAGDVTFVAQVILDDSGTPYLQQRYRYFGHMASANSYRFTTPDREGIEALARLVRGPVANSRWFALAKRFFLAGGAKEFNPHIGELDRILDFVVALEAVLVFENEFVARLIRDRAVALLGLDGGPAENLRQLLKIFYGHRSKIAHRETVLVENPSALQEQMGGFELVTRELLKAALHRLPADLDAHEAALLNMAQVSDDDRIDFLVQRAKGLTKSEKRARIIDALNS